MHFKEEHFEKMFVLKKNERIIFKGQYSSIKHGQPKRKQNHKRKVLETKPTKVVRVGSTFMGFQWPSKK